MSQQSWKKRFPLAGVGSVVIVAVALAASCGGRIDFTDLAAAALDATAPGDGSTIPMSDAMADDGGDVDAAPSCPTAQTLTLDVVGSAKTAGSAGKDYYALNLATPTERLWTPRDPRFA